MITELIAASAGGILAVIVFAAFVAKAGQSRLERRESARLAVLSASAALTVLKRDNALPVQTADEVDRIAHELAVAAENLQW